ncbi:Thiosulfate/3-mercaptopyruvate sulfurtransferase 1, mitochondrial [Linum perenne]
MASTLGWKATFSTQLLSTSEPVVSVDWLHSNLRAPDLKVLDASWCIPDEQRNPIEEYQVAHIPEPPKNSMEVFKRWGCSETDLNKIFSRRPALRNAGVPLLEFKLTVLQNLGLKVPDLVQIINCRPHFLSYRMTGSFDEHMGYFMELFGTKESVLKAIVRNPSLLRYDLQNKIKPVVALYESMGISKQSFAKMLLSRPALIARTCFDDEKMECIRKTGVSTSSKMYKYVITIVGISKTETLLGKVANLEKFGFPEEEVWSLVGRSPYLLTLAIDKVQRNMTYIVGTMKLPANVILKHPFLLYANLDTVLKPRILLAGKLEEMGLSPKIEGHNLVRVMKMTEKRLIKVYISCHPEDIVTELMASYEKAKGLRRLAQAAKKSVFERFPF